MERDDHRRDALRMTQFLLAALTLAAFILSTSRHERYRRIAPLIGLPAQIPWIASVNWTEQWGIGLVTLVYTARYVHLAWRSWGPASRR